MASGFGLRDRLDLHAALGGAHHPDALGAAVEDRREVELLDDVRGGRHEHPADRDALDVHAQDRARDRLGLIGGARRA